MRWRCVLYQDLSFVASFLNDIYSTQVIVFMMSGDFFYFFFYRTGSGKHDGDKSLVLVMVFFMILSITIFKKIRVK